VHPIAFRIGSLSIYWYGILIATGFLVGLWTASRRGLRDGLPPEAIIDLGPWLVLGAIVGARLLYVITFWQDYYASHPFYEVFIIRQGGLVYYGGLIGAVATSLFYIYRKKLPLWRTADALAPSIALGYVPGRFGCLATGCCYGRPTNLPWAIRFPRDHETGGVPVHPTQIYEALLNLLLFAVLAKLYRHRKFEGQVFAAYLVGYAALRSLVECFRGDYRTYYLGNLMTPGQVMSIVILLAGCGLWWQRSRAQSSSTESAA
jgi:phosphatidylglycerol---prolipoprotein diacylglyceryl transferase